MDLCKYAKEHGLEIDNDAILYDEKRCRQNADGSTKL